MEMTTSDPGYREVADLANDLYKAGLKDPGVAAVRQILTEKCAGTGRKTQSAASIRSALVLWTETERPADAKHSVPVLSQSIAVEMHRTIQAAELRVHELLEPRLQALSAELKDAANSCLEYEAQIEEKAALVTQRTRERDIAAGQLHAQTAQNVDLAAALECERKQADQLRLQLARDQIGMEAAARHVNEAKERECALRKDVAQVHADLLAERTSRADAERRSDIAGVRLELEVKARTAAEATVSKLLVAVGSIDSSSSRAMAAEASAKELRAHIATLSVLLTAATTSRSKAEESKRADPLQIPAGTPPATSTEEEAAVSDAGAGAGAGAGVDSRSLKSGHAPDRTELVHQSAGECEQPPDRLNDQPETEGSG